MNPNKIYHSLHYLTMPFGFVAAYYIFSGTYYTYSIEDIGLGVLLLGIAYGFASMNDMTKFSKKEIAMFEDNKAYKKAINQILYMGIGMIITTITFISQRWLFPSKTGEAYFNLGLMFSAMQHPKSIFL